MKEIEYIKINEGTEEYINWLYQTYVQEDDSNLDTYAKELKYHLKYVIDYLSNNEAIDKEKMYVEQSPLEKRVEQLEREVNMLKANSTNRPTYSYGIR